MSGKGSRALPSDTAAANWTNRPSATLIGMTHMKRQYSAAVAAVFLLTASSLAARAKDAAQAPAAPAAAPSDSPPSSVARPSIVPKTNDTAAKPDTSARPQADAEPASRRHRRYARHHYRRYAYWEPFPIFFPRFTRHHGVYWSRVPWFF
jgi:hypothetical protein